VDEIRLETIKRHSEEPRLEIGDTVVVHDGAKGTVLARYIPSAHKTEVRYIVAIPSAKQPKRSR
jgi:hypothetical protein